MTQVFNVLFITEFTVELFAIDFLLFHTYPKRKFWLLSLVIGFIASFSILLLRLWIPSDKNAIYSFSVLYFCSFLFVSLSFSYSYKIPFSSSLSLCTIGYSFQHIGYSLASIITTIINSPSALGITIPSALLLTLDYSTFTLLYLFVYLFFIKKMNGEIILVSWRRAVVSFLAIFIITAVVNLLIVLSDDLSALMVVANRILAIMACLFVIELQHSLASEGEKEKENSILKGILDSEKKHQKMSEESMNVINIKAHDLKKMIGYLKESDSPDDRKAIAEETNNAINEYSSLAHTQNNTLDQVLFEKNLICLNHSIHLVAVCEGKLLSCMEDTDIYSMFTNILDNAIEAQLKVPDKEKRDIHLKVNEFHGFIKIEENNYYNGKVSLVNGNVITSKSDKVNHGYGIKSIKFIVDKYHGNTVIDTDNQLFKISIIIPHS